MTTPAAAWLFARTFVIGLAIAAPVGAMAMLCIQRTLAGGWRQGMATGLGIATADGTYAGLAAFGVAAVSSALVSWQVPLRLVGGAVLVHLGLRSLLARRERDCADASDGATPSRPRHASLYASALGLTLANPLTIMAFGAVFASAGIVAQPGLAPAAIATVGVALGSLSWWTALVTGVSAARHGVAPGVVTAVGRVSGAVIIAFGALAIGAAIVALAH